MRDEAVVLLAIIITSIICYFMYCWYPKHKGYPECGHVYNPIQCIQMIEIMKRGK